jgi:predicted DNA-binding transcriptional regulator AlpA
MSISQAEDRFLSSRVVRHRYGDVSDMWLWRRIRDGSGFPRPIQIMGRRFWRLSELIAWERQRAENGAKENGANRAIFRREAAAVKTSV